MLSSRRRQRSRETRRQLTCMRCEAWLIFFLKLHVTLILLSPQDHRSSKEVPPVALLGHSPNGGPLHLTEIVQQVQKWNLKFR